MIDHNYILCIMRIHFFYVEVVGRAVERSGGRAAGGRSVRSVGRMVIFAPSWLTFGATLEEPRVNLDALATNLDALAANLDAPGVHLGPT